MKYPSFLNKILWLIALFCFGISACSAASTQTRADVYNESAAVSGGAPSMEASIAQSEGKSFDRAVLSSEQSVDRLVIKDASLTLIVNDPANSMERITFLAEELGGFVVNANMNQTQYQGGVEAPRASITIRVPADRLNDALTKIKAESEQPPQNETINSQDVTSDYTDLQSRLRNLEAAESQLSEIMGSATRTEDVLNVYNQLVQVREQIEVIKGQIKYYEQSAALSSIKVELLPNEAVQPLTIGGWQPVGVAKDAVQALINALRFLGTAAIWLVLFAIPVLIVMYVVFYLPLSFIWRRMRIRRISAKPAVEEKS